ETPVLWDHKAFLFDRSRNLLVFPVLVAEIDREKYSGEVPPQTFGEYVFQGAYVFKVSLDTGIVLRGKITHIENDDLLKSGYYFGSQYSVKRALYIGNVLYTISEKKIKANSLEDLGLIGEVELP
ncbi:MAG: beta-propeller domain-containing protein, partial [Candidatus Bathyarchaeota archaeon]|nr:beta-propeller domain-containing protein [Candidatus Bathyarchaeota archaeon]